MMKKLTAIFLVIVLLATVLPAHADGMPGTVPPAQAEAVDAVPLSLSAECAVLLDADSGQVLFGHNANLRHAIASTTKIMTALVALEASDLSEEVMVPAEAVGVEGSSVYLYSGEKLTMEELLYALLLESANDAAAAIAIKVGGSPEAFADLMNEKARALGLSDTHFENPHGLSSPEHYSTAKDLATLSAYALRCEPFAKIVSTYRAEIPLRGGEGVRLLINHNKLLKSYPGAIGVKTGYTKASGRCLVTAAERNGLRLVAVTLNAPGDWADHRAMLDMGFASFCREELMPRDGFSRTLPVVGGETAQITVGCTDAPAVTLPISHGEITHTVSAPHFLYAPLKAGDVVGAITYYLDGRVIASAELRCQSSVSEQPRRISFFEFVKQLFGGS